MKQTKFYLGLLVFCAFFLLNAKSNVIATLEYFYAKDGTIIGRSINGVMQDYSYDKKGQLLSVSNSKTGQKVEEYVYDPAGNILRKTVNGKTTVYTYDDANQLMTSTKDGKVTTYKYDAAGRMIQEGAKTYSYGYLDKVMSVQENGADIASFTYHADGQISSANTKIGKETFLWDGLALIGRDATQYVNEPYVTGGNPILANDKVLFNDILGTTLGVNSDKYAAIPRDAFGMTEQSGSDEFFTGKPYIGELGYAFLFRNYRAEQGKWQTSDPIGYPDGWNNLAYCSSNPVETIDIFGLLNFYEGNFSQHLFEAVPPSYYRTQAIDFAATTTKMIATANMNAVSLIYPLAGAMANFYLGGTGNSYNIPTLYLGNILKNKGYINDAIYSAKSYLSSFRDNLTSLSFLSSWITSSLPDDSDAGLALHNFQYSVSGKAFRQNDNSIKVTLSLHVYDFYDFDSSEIFAGFGLTDTDWRHLTEVGLACPYNVIGGNFKSN